MTPQPGHTEYLAHFTSGDDAYDDLVSILTDGVVIAGTVPWTNQEAVCLTECPWASLLDHARRYSPYAVGFGKHHVFAAGGGPAFYVRPDCFHEQQWDPRVYPFVTPFWPAYRPVKLRDRRYLSGKTVDYSHEREWRVPHDFKFDTGRLSFVILDTYEDMARFPKNLKDEIGREKFILMDIYRTIEELWPTHVMNRD